MLLVRAGVLVYVVCISLLATVASYLAVDTATQLHARTVCMSLCIILMYAY
jgi:hypothetical protein